MLHKAAVGGSGKGLTGRCPLLLPGPLSPPRRIPRVHLSLGGSHDLLHGLGEPLKGGLRLA